MSVKNVQAILSGKVQGVGFRYYATHVAESYGVVGTVRNLPEGRVEAIAEGDERELSQFVAELQRGPRAAEVRDVQIAWGEPTGQFNHFESIS